MYSANGPSIETFEDLTIELYEATQITVPTRGHAPRTSETPALMLTAIRPSPPQSWIRQLGGIGNAGPDRAPDPAGHAHSADTAALAKPAAVVGPSPEPGGPLNHQDAGPASGAP